MKEGTGSKDIVLLWLELQISTSIWQSLLQNLLCIFLCGKLDQSSPTNIKFVRNMTRKPATVDLKEVNTQTCKRKEIQILPALIWINISIQCNATFVSLLATLRCYTFMQNLPKMNQPDLAAKNQNDSPLRIKVHYRSNCCKILYVALHTN